MPVSGPAAASPYRLADEVHAALAARRPVVALESSLVAHGFPKPDNLDVAREVEATLRAGGAVPATIAIVGGEIRVGLAADELRLIATDPGVRKCSTRDLGHLVAARHHGATTVAATARIAAAVGVEVFATGGIGGVHRGAAQSHDVSADLVELGRTPIAVVCAGAKALLDLPATLEFLETQSVAVIGYRCDEFPAFYTAASGLPLGCRTDEVAHLAAIVRAHRRAGAPSAVVVCNPPPEKHALPAAELEGLIARALEAAAKSGVSGPEVTPFVLADLARRSDGRTRACNRALVLDNARVGAALACALAARWR